MHFSNANKIFITPKQTRERETQNVYKFGTIDD